ncbi:MAG: hypothetical protein AAB401_06675 [Acidobacteriota bacterium]
MGSLAFRKNYSYDLNQPGITVPVYLSLGETRIELHAKVDCGASACIFARGHGELLGLNIESGTPEYFGTATGRFKAYGHPITLSVLEFEFDSVVYFAEDPAFTREVLGRQGWLDRLRFGLVDYEGKLYLSDYNDPTS